MSFFKKIISWFAKAGKTIEHDAAKLAVIITEALKTGVGEKCLDIVGYIVDYLTKSGVGTEDVAKLKLILPNLMSIALGLEAPPDQATPEQLTAWGEAVLKALGINSDASKLYTTLAADLAKDIQTKIYANQGKPLTFAQWVAIVEDAFQDYQSHQEITETFPIDTEAPEKTV